LIIPDVNVLIYAFRESAPDHAAYADWLAGVVAGDDEIGLLDTVLTGFVRIVTNPRIVDPAAGTDTALEFVRVLRSARRAVLLGSTAALWQRVETLALSDGALRGNYIPDLYIAAAAIEYGGTVATADRGFGRYPGLRWFTPVS
jgi:toxin-antitoxin system PIN domain toxin